MKNIIRFLNNLGPGILAASAAIGASHLIQSTRAGGQFGFELLWIVILVNILKYPFIEYGFRYSGATGQNLLQAYNKLHKNYLRFFVITNIVSAIGAIALLSYVAGAISKSVLNLDIDVKIITLIIMVIFTAIITLKNYDFLDNIMKIFMVLLFFSTFLAVIFAITNHNPDQSDIIYHSSAWSNNNLPFIIALMGWMPGPMEIGVWYSLWLQAKNKGKNKINFKQAKFDFNFGYILIIITAIFFVTLGALILHHSGIEISNNGSVFAGQLLSIYTLTIGDWSKIIISTAILTAILSTTITVIDIYPRSISMSLQILGNRDDNFEKKQRLKLTIIFCIIAFAIIYFLVNNFKTIADIVTIISFIFAPFFAFLNYKVVTSKLLDKKFHPNIYLKILSFIGLAFMVIFVLIFIFVRFL
ncbi:Nramp family divalent metal transporter [Rickettsiales bacterium]|nr:Nramp family divalent metal transporter [Rickettsiales bacterium]